MSTTQRSREAFERAASLAGFLSRKRNATRSPAVRYRAALAALTTSRPEVTAYAAAFAAPITVAHPDWTPSQVAAAAAGTAADFLADDNRPSRTTVPAGLTLESLGTFTATAGPDSLYRTTVRTALADALADLAAVDPLMADAAREAFDTARKALPPIVPVADNRKARREARAERRAAADRDAYTTALVDILDALPTDAAARVLAAVNGCAREARSALTDAATLPPRAPHNPPPLGRPSDPDSGTAGVVRVERQQPDGTRITVALLVDGTRYDVPEQDGPALSALPLDRLSSTHATDAYRPTPDERSQEARMAEAWRTSGPVKQPSTRRNKRAGGIGTPTTTHSPRPRPSALRLPLTDLDRYASDPGPATVALVAQVPTPAEQHAARQARKPRPYGGTSPDALAYAETARHILDAIDDPKDPRDPGAPFPLAPAFRAT